MNMTAHRWFRRNFGLRTLMLAVLLLCTASAWMGAEVRDELLVREFCNRVSGKIGYDYQWRTTPHSFIFGGYIDDQGSAPEQTWVSKLVGREFATDIVSVRLSGCKASDDELALLGRLTRLKEIDLSDSGISDAGLARLRRCSRLEKLSLNGTRVTGVGLRELRNFPKLQCLKLDASLITKENLRALKQLKSLSYIEVHDSFLHDCWRIINTEPEVPAVWWEGVN